MGQLSNIGPSHAARRDDDRPCNIAIGSRAYRAASVTRTHSCRLDVSGLEMPYREAEALLTSGRPVLLSLSDVAAMVTVVDFRSFIGGTVMMSLRVIGRVDVVRGSRLVAIAIDGEWA